MLLDHVRRPELFSTIRILFLFIEYVFQITELLVLVKAMINKKDKLKEIQISLI